MWDIDQQKSQKSVPINSSYYTDNDGWFGIDMSQNFIVVAINDNTWVINTESGDVVANLERGYFGSIVSISPDERYIAVAVPYVYPDVTVWDTQSWEKVHTFLTDAYDLAWSPDSKTLAAASSYSVQIWQVAE